MEKQDITIKNEKAIKKTLPDGIKTTISYKITKWSSIFPVKDKTDFQHRYNFVFYVKRFGNECKDDYVGEKKMFGRKTFRY